MLMFSEHLATQRDACYLHCNVHFIKWRISLLTLWFSPCADILATTPSLWLFHVSWISIRNQHFKSLKKPINTATTSFKTCVDTAVQESVLTSEWLAAHVSMKTKTEPSYVLYVRYVACCAPPSCAKLWDGACCTEVIIMRTDENFSCERVNTPASHK